ncbi:MAG: GntR family transcriptional regulator [Cyanobacteria bacterium P01_H01_bin.15]
MFRFQIQTESDIPASKQLFDQIQFAIASGQYPPGQRLPSTRQLAMLTGLHRNTISKVYRQLEDTGLVESLAGSGIYVRHQRHDGARVLDSPLLKQFPEAETLVQESLDSLLRQGCTLSQARELLLNEINWRLNCGGRLIICVPERDLSAGELMLAEIEEALDIPMQLTTLEELPAFLASSQYGTIVTSRYFIGEVLAVVSPQLVRVIPIDMYDYAKELAIIKKLPKDACLGLVSLSTGTLTVAETIVHSQRGDDLLIVTAQADDTTRLAGLVRSAQTIVSDPSSYDQVKTAIQAARSDLIRAPEIIRSENYVGKKAIRALRRELGMGLDSLEDDDT